MSSKENSSVSPEAPPNLPVELAGLTPEEWVEKYARLLAEFDNYRRRTREDMERQSQSKKNSFILDLLQVVDNFERALDMAQGANTDLTEGMRAIDKQLRDLLAAHDVKPLDSLGQPFDPNLHEAIGMMPSPDHAPGTVCAVAQRGWMRGETVLRHARVMVAQEPPAEEAPEPAE